MNLVLFQPEIPQNTGAIGRLCVCTGSPLHLIKPLGFDLDEKKVRRAGMDYWFHIDLHIHESWEHFLDTLPQQSRLHFLSTRGKENIYQRQFHKNDYLVLGRESSGLPPDFYQTYAEDLVTIPMNGQFARSLNIANSAGIALYEAIRQINYS